MPKDVWCYCKCLNIIIRLLFHWPSNLFLRLGYDLWSCFGIMVSFYHLWVFLIASCAYAISAPCVGLALCFATNTLCYLLCVSWFCGVCFVVVPKSSPPHRNASGKRKMLDSSSTQQSQIPRVQRELSPAFGNIQFCNTHRRIIMTQEVQHANFVVKGRVEWRTFQGIPIFREGIWFWYQMIPCQPYQNSISMKHVSKK